MDNLAQAAVGAAYQFANDLTSGGVDRIADSYNVCMYCNKSNAFRQGQQVGRATSIIVGSTEQIMGAAMTASAIAALPGTAAGGASCTVVTGGVCAIPTGGLLVLEALAAVEGGLEYAHGSAVIAYAKNNPLGTTSQSPNEIRRSISSLEKIIAEHEAKLKAYIEDPYALDNQGLLEKASTEEMRQSIINGRINHLSRR